MKEKEIFHPWLFNSLFIVILTLFFHLFCSLLKKIYFYLIFPCFLLSLSMRERIQENFFIFFHSFLSFLSNNIFYIIKLFSLGHKLIKMAKCCITTHFLYIFNTGVYYLLLPHQQQWPNYYLWHFFFALQSLCLPTLENV